MFRSVSALLADNPSQHNFGITVTDLDGDGHFECFVCGSGSRSIVFKWGGDAFFDVADRTLADAAAFSSRAAAADVDGDGREELYVLNHKGDDRLFAWRKGAWTNLFDTGGNRPLVNQGAGRAVVALDRFGLGRYGFLVASDASPFRLYELMSEDKLQDLALPLGFGRPSNGCGLVVAPLSGERLDILATNRKGPNFLFTDRAKGIFTDVAAACGLNEPLEDCQCCALADLNHDGRFDLICGSWRGAHRLFVQGASGRFADCASPDVSYPSRVNSIVAADFDNDGYEEIFFSNLGQSNRLFAWRDGDWRLVHCGAAIEAAEMGSYMAVGDFNGDGRLELMIAHSAWSREAVSLYAPESNANHHLRVLPLTAAGAPARGAFVRIDAGGRTQIRTIDSGGSYEPVAHFGLGATTRVESLEVRWPDGASVALNPAECDVLLRVPYPS